MTTSNNAGQVHTNHIVSSGPIEMTPKAKRQSILDKMPEGPLKEKEKEIEKTFDRIENSFDRISTTTNKLLETSLYKKIKNIFIETLKLSFWAFIFVGILLLFVSSENDKRCDAYGDRLGYAADVINKECHLKVDGKWISLDNLTLKVEK